MNALTRTACAAALAAAAAAPAPGDSLRNVEPGETVPEFSLATVSGGRVGRAELEGRPVILVFLSAEQRSSESAAVSARDVLAELERGDVSLLYVTADVARAPYFRQLRDAKGLEAPIALDVDRRLYGDLGLIVLPTTIVIRPDWTLGHVISSYRPDYEHVLHAYAEHVLGVLDEEALARRLEAKTFQRGLPEHKVARHRAAARVMWESGLTADAQRELRAALAIDPADPASRLDLAALLARTGRAPAARAIVDDVLAKHPDHRRGRLILGVVLYHAGELDAAQAALEKTIVLNPDPVQAHYYLGLIHERKGDLPAAIEHFKASLSRLLENRPFQGPYWS